MDTSLKQGLVAAFKKEPFAKSMGISLKVLDTGYARVEMPYDPFKMGNIYERAHGGAIFALIDEAFQLACQSYGTITVALNVNVTYISSPERETRLTATAEETHKTRKTTGYDIRVVDEQERLVATCRALAYITGKPVPFSTTPDPSKT